MFSNIYTIPVSVSAVDAVYVYFVYMLSYKTLIYNVQDVAIATARAN